MIYSVVCEHIRELRLQRGMTQVDLAKRLGVSKSVVSSYENGVHLPPYDILTRISSLFGVSCDYLPWRLRRAPHLHRRPDKETDRSPAKDRRRTAPTEPQCQRAGIVPQIFTHHFPIP